MSIKRIGFVGVGNMGQAAHLQNYLTVPGCQVVALAEVRPGLGKAVGARYGIANVYPDAQAMLANEELDGIVASQPFTRHAAIVPPLLRKNCPVLTEKPLAGTVESGEKILDALRASGGKLFIAYNKRSDPATMRAKRQIAEWQASGEVGKMRYVRIAMPPGDWIANGFNHLLNSNDPYPSNPDDSIPSGWDEATFKRNFIFVNFYIHQVNLLRHLLGEDYTLQFADPTGVLFVAKSNSGVCGTIEMEAFRTTQDWQEEAFIAFERGWIKLELRAPVVSNQAGKVTIFSDKGDGAEPMTIIPTLPTIHSMRSQAMNFVKALSGEPTPLCEAAEAIKDLQIARDYIHMTGNAAK